ncbi:orotate phosphoribosyltransferase [Salsuginibacillus kocurii]|uniref:orotate phosphoribosyltransferase n=1 Tax=Salsuginibacillus kocurii TaxID=427078 RepID=UPI000373CF25|nr:orotate phosphoribosyltransferase [Salsuginibacillus kocurii]
MNHVIASHLLSIEAVSLAPNDPFTWTSGIKSPIYCDNRLILSYPAVRKDVIQGFTELIQREFSMVDVIAGTATAGIPHAAWISERLDLPMLYVRGSAKSHGKGNRIEGAYEKGQRVVLIEDLISTGKSVIEAAEALRNEGMEVAGVVSIFTYGLNKGKKQLADASLPSYSLTNLEVLMREARRNGAITAADENKIKQFQQDPSDSRWMHLQEKHGILNF